MTKRNRFLQAALEYAGFGYDVFACAPGRKQPLTVHGCLDATANIEKIEEMWNRQPKANVAIATNGLLVVDLDEKNTWLVNEEDKLLDMAVAPLSLTPNRGFHYIFRQPPGKTWRNTTAALAAKVDTRANGGYILVPPSVLARKAYRWGQTLEMSPENLPEPPAWLITFLDNLNGEVARVADSNQIPSGHRNSTLARLAGAMRHVGMAKSEILAALLQANATRCTPPLKQREVERIAESISRYKPDQVSVALAENHYAQMYEGSAETVDEYPDPGPVPGKLLRAPGFIDQVVTYALENAPYPEPVLAFAGALSLQAVLAGRKVRDAADNRTNLNVLALANSGVGKDFPRKVNQRILLHAGMADAIGDTFASGEGIEDRLFVQPAVLFQTDEIDGLMAKINLAGDARHEGIMNVLLKMYSSANALYPIRVKAGKEPGVIDQPCVCVFGTAIPKHYYEALSFKMLTNGFFARMLVLESGRRRKGQETTVAEIPKSILQTARWWVDFQPGRRGNLKSLHPVPKIVEYSPAAAAIFRELREEADQRYSEAEERNDTIGMAIWARAHEKARRLALIYACSKDYEKPLIDQTAAQWAGQFVDHQTRRMLFMMNQHVSENEFHGRCKRLVTLLHEWKETHGDEWMPYWRINRKLPWTAREHQEIRTTLINQRIIEFDERGTGGRPQKLYRLLRN